ncbi:polyprotein [Salanga virus]|uniref:Envelopment polyprotein n=1 Tax=Salanga virus TaxID=1416745 RepID=U5XM01_9VIRU|nr:polyprotein [Salanga virus]AGZ62536.1 polyprotein [Salanga virus]
MYGRFLFTALFGIAACMFKLETESQRYTNQICFSSSTPVKDMIRYWDSEIRRVPGTDYQCRFNTDPFARTTSQGSRELLVSITSRTAENKYECLSQFNDSRIEFSSDGYSEEFEPAAMMCDEEKVDFLIQPVVDQGAPAVDLESELAKLKQQAKDDMNTLISEHNKAIQELNNLRSADVRKLREVETLLRLAEKGILSGNTTQLRLRQEVSSLRSQINDVNQLLEKERKEKISTRKSLEELEQDAQENVEFKESIITDLRKQLAESDSKMKQLYENLTMIRLNHNRLMQEKQNDGVLTQLRIEMDKQVSENNYANEVIREQGQLIEELRKNSSIQVSVKSSTPLVPLLILTSLLCNLTCGDRTHIDNRIVDKVYIINGDSGSGCTKIDYGSDCPSWIAQKEIEQYPFFNSHFHQRSLIEAVNDGILSKEDKTVCMLTTNNSRKTQKCIKGMINMKPSCKTKAKSAYYINDSGKVSGMMCDTSYALASDCKFCVKVTGSVDTSIPLQDVFCQKNHSNYDGPSERLTGICSVGYQKFKSCPGVVSKYETMPFIVFDSKKVYLSVLQMRNTEEAMKENFRCYRHKNQHGISGSDSNKGDFVRVLPSDCKIFDSSKSKKCTGDDIFCSHFECDNDFPDTICKVAPGAGPIEVKYAGVWTRPRCVGFEVVAVKRDIPTIKEKLIGSCPSCVAVCEKNGIHVTGHGFLMTSAIACSHGSCVSSHQDPKTDIWIPYPGMSQVSGGRVGLHISSSDTIGDVHLTVDCEPQDGCSIDNCVLCWHGFINYHCHTFISALVAMTLLTSFITLLAVGIRFFLKMAKSTPGRLIIPFMWAYLAVKWVSCKLRACIAARTRILNQAIGWPNRDNFNVRREPGRPWVPRYHLAMAILGILFTPGLCCTENVIATSKVNRCSSVGSGVICKLSGLVTLRAGPIGSESCLIINGPNPDQTQYISIRTDSSDLVCVEGDHFWTSHYSSRCLSSRRCHGVAECVDTACSSWNVSTVSMEFRNLKDSPLMSENKCFEQCGAIGCGCFNINPSCLFVHSTLYPTRRESFKVFKCVNWIHRLGLTLKSPGIPEKHLLISGMTTKVTDFGSITLTIDAEGIKGTNSYSFMKSEVGNFAIVDEPYSDIPRKGYLGEVRCTSQAAASSAHSTCQRAPDLISYRAQLDSAECNTALVDPAVIFKRGQLPKSREGITFTSAIDRSTVQALTSGFINAEFTLNFDGFDVQFISDTPNCEVSFLNVTGCYSCDEGAKVCIRAKSDKRGILSAQDASLSNSIHREVAAGQQDICSILHFNKPELKEEMGYSCGGERRPLIIKGTLIAVGTHDDRTSLLSHSTVVNPSSGSWSAVSWFRGFLDWMENPLKAVGLILLYVILSVVVLFVIMLIIRALMARVLKLWAKKRM